MISQKPQNVANMHVFSLSSNSNTIPEEKQIYLLYSEKRLLFDSMISSDADFSANHYISGKNRHLLMKGRRRFFISSALLKGGVVSQTSEYCTQFRLPRNFWSILM